MRVAVAGAGIGGLTLALALRDHGIEVAIHEQAEQVTEIGAGVALGANSTRLLSALGLGAELARVGSVPPEIVFRHADGTAVARHRLDEPYEQRFGGRFYGLHRKDLQRALLDAVGDGVVHTGHRCVDVVETGGRARLVLENGHTDDADVVVAADGVHSALRRTVSDGGSPVFSGAVGYRGTIPIEQLPALPDPLAVQFWMGPGRHLLHYPIDAGAVVNFLAVVRTPRWTAERWMEQCDPADAVGAYAGWHPAVTEMVGAAPEGARWALFERRPLKRWSRGRVVLVGDSAHAMLPHQGQGAGQTVEDAVALADCLAAAGPGRHTEAFARYEAVRLRRTRRVQAASRRAFDLLHLPAGPEADARDAELPRLDDALTWIHAHDVRGAGVPVA